MRTVAPMTEQFQHFVADLKETFWGDVYGKARGALEEFLAQESARLRDQYVRSEPRKQSPTRRGQRNGFYWRDFVTRLGTLRLKIARTREKSLLAAPEGPGLSPSADLRSSGNRRARPRSAHPAAPSPSVLPPNAGVTSPVHIRSNSPSAPTGVDRYFVGANRLFPDQLILYRRPDTLPPPVATPQRLRPSENRTFPEFAPRSNLKPAPTRQFLDPLTLL